MFSSSIRASLVALVASAVAVCAAPILTVDLLRLIIAVDIGVGGLATTTVSNNGDKEIKLLKDPRGVLDSFPEDSFTITDSTGSRPSFNGAKVGHRSGYLTNLRADAFGFQAKFSPTYAASLDDPSVYVVLPPGGSTKVTHDRKWDRLDHFNGSSVISWNDHQ